MGYNPYEWTNGELITDVKLNHIEDGIGSNSEDIEALRGAYGTPLVASSVADMTDTNKIYVYVGNESGYTNGHWYYYNGTAWADGGAYNATALVTDTTLSVAGMAADAKATGDAVDELKDELNASVDLSSYTWKIGSLVSGTGAENNMTTRIRSNYIPVTKGTDIRVTGNPQCLIVYSFTDKYAYIADTTWTDTANHYVVPDGVSYVRILIRGSNLNPSISSSDIATQVQRCSLNLALNQGTYFITETVSALTNTVTKGETIDADVSFTETSDSVINSSKGISTGVGNQYKISDQIPVKKGEKYSLSAYMNWGNYYYVFYDLNNNAFGGQKCSASGTFERFNDIIEIPEKAVKIRIGFYIDGSKVCSFKKIVPAVVADRISDYAQRDWLGKKWVVIGDSLTEINSTADKKYHDVIAEKTGITVYNYGKSGTGYGKTYSTYNNFADRVLELSDVDCDVITIFGGLNDLSITMGTADDTGTNTIGGWMNTTFDNLFTTKPFVSVGVILPTPWWGYAPIGTSENDQKAIQYCEMLTTICERRSIPVLNLFNRSNLHPDDSSFRTEFFNNADGVHPNNKGHAKIAPMVLEFLKDLVEL